MTAQPETEQARIRIGLSGWSYGHWKGRFYPKGLQPSEELAYVAERFDTVEINRSFYSLLEPSVYRRWHDTVPDDFVFAVKGSRFITHMKKLNDPEVSLGNFLASGIFELGDKLGPFLWQLPGRWRYDHARVDRFLSLLPRTMDEARELASGHDSRVRNSTLPEASSHRLRHALEVRDPSFFDPRLIDALAARGVSLAFSHSAVWPYVEDLTSDLVYVRLHGPDALYASPYDGDQLTAWAHRIQAWRQGEPATARVSTGSVPARDVFVYFDNDGDAHAPRNARQLRELCGG